MRSYEVGVLPESSCFFFSPSPEIQKLFYHHTMCGHFFCTGDYYIKRSTYPPMLLVYVVQGTFFLELDGKVYETHSGQVALFDCRQPHYYYTADGTEFFYIHFDGPKAHELCSYINKTSGLVIDGENNEAIYQILADMLKFYEDGNSESVFSISGRIYRLITLLDNPVVSPRLKKNDDSIARAIAYIRSNVGKKISLQELANISGLSIYYFSHLFKEMTGQSPMEFVIYSRIDQAKVLLVETGFSVSEVAQQVGYSNSGNLITHFTQRVGCSPSQFRKNNRTIRPTRSQVIKQASSKGSAPGPRPLL